MENILMAVILGLIIAGLYIWYDKGNEANDKIRAQIRDLEYKGKLLEKEKEVK